MDVLIVEKNLDLARVWQGHLARFGADVSIATSQSDAIEHLRFGSADIVVLDLDLGEDSAIAVADFLSYRHPHAKIVFVTNTTFFSDGSIFNHIPNACAFLKTQTPPDDLAAIVEHYGQPG